MSRDKLLCPGTSRDKITFYFVHLLQIIARPVPWKPYCIYCATNNPISNRFDNWKFERPMVNRDCNPNGTFDCKSQGLIYFVDNDISWTLFFKRVGISWTFEDEFLWTFLVTFRGHFCPRNVTCLSQYTY